MTRNQFAKLQAANKAVTRCNLHKRKRIQRKETLTVSKGVRLTTLKGFNPCSNRKRASKKARVETGTLGLQDIAACVARQGTTCEYVRTMRKRVD